MKKSLVLWLTILLLMIAFIGTVMAIDDPYCIQTNKENISYCNDYTIGACPFDSTGVVSYSHHFNIAVLRVKSFDLYIDEVTNGEVNGPVLSSSNQNNNQDVVTVSPGHYRVMNKTGTFFIEFSISETTTPRDYTFRMVDIDNVYSTKSVIIHVLPKWVPTPTPTPTPIPTPTIGSITITSNPTGASIFLDNAIKGITPLTLKDVPNGAHVVLLRYNGYQDYSTSVTVLGDTSTVNPTLEKISSSTQTTVVPTVTTTTSQLIPTTTLSTQIPTSTTATPRPTSKVNYSATIATMQSQIAEQNAKIEEQGSWIDQILKFLGLK